MQTHKDLTALFALIALLAAQPGCDSVDKGDLVWAKGAGGPGKDEPYDIAHWDDGSFLIGGDAGGPITLGRGESNETIVSAADGNSGTRFFARYNADGTLRWARRTVVGGTPWSSVDVLKDGSFLWTGGGHYDPIMSPNEATTVRPVGRGEEECGGACIAKFDPNGALVWINQLSESSIVETHGLVTLDDGSYYVTGYPYNPFELNSGEKNDTTTEPDDLLYETSIAKYNPDDTLAWVKENLGMTALLTVLKDGSPVTAGRFVQAVDTPEEYFFGLYVAKYHPDGTRAWQKRTSTVSSYGYGCYALDLASLDDGSVLLAGICAEPTTFGVGEPNETVISGLDLGPESDCYDCGKSSIFVARYLHNGNLAWAKNVAQVDYSCSGYSLAASGGDSFWLGWSCDGWDDYHNVKPCLRSGWFLDKYSADGTRVWAKNLCNRSNPSFAEPEQLDELKGWTEMEPAHCQDIDDIEIEDITALPTGSLLVTGAFKAQADFGVGEKNQTKLTAAGSWDIFAAKFGP